MGVAVPFPRTQPAGYEWFDDEPAFDPAVHLQLDEPDEIVMLSDLGYTDAEIATKATPVAASSPFRMLSDDGARLMLDVARRLKPFARPAGDRIENMVRGGCYRSRWLRDFCQNEDVCEHLRHIFGVPVAPHPMALQTGHINFEPSSLDAAIDKWHNDTVPLTYVLTVTDPAQVAGGRFQYFWGTKSEAAEMAAENKTPSGERVVTPDLPGPGYALAMQGDMVVHRAAPLSAMCERISMVSAYVSLDTSVDLQSRTADLIIVDDHEVLWTEWAKLVAWRSQGRLEALIQDLEFTADRDMVIQALESAISDVQLAIGEMRSGKNTTDHYGG